MSKSVNLFITKEMKFKGLCWLMAMCVFTLCCSFSCSDDTLGGGDGGDEVKQPDPIKPGASKEFFQETAIEFLDKISAQDYQNLSDFSKYLSEEFEYFDIDEDFVDLVESLYDEDHQSNEYYGAPLRNPVQMLSDLSQLALEVAGNSFGIGDYLTEIYEYFNYYSFSMDAALSDLYGKFKPNYEDEIFEFDNRSVKDRMEISIQDNNGDVWVAILKGSESTSYVTLNYRYYGDYSYKEDYSYDYSYGYKDEYSDEYDVVVEIPEEIEFFLTCNGSNVVSLTVDSKIPLSIEWDEDCYREDGCDEYGDWYYNHDHNFDVSLDYTELIVNAELSVNNYSEKFSSSINDNAISFNSLMKIDDTDMIEASIVAKGDFKEIKENFSENINEWYDDEDVDLNELGKISGSINILDRVQFDLSCNSVDGIIASIENIDDHDYGSDDHDFKVFTNYVNELNEKFDVKVYYNNEKTLQAVLKMEAEKDYYDEWNEEYYYDVCPIIIFESDGSKYSLEEFFDDNIFNKVENKFEKLVEDFEELFDF